MSWLLDTDACIDVLRARDASLARRLGSYDGLGVSSVTVSELAYGAARSRDPDGNSQEVRLFLASIDVRPFDEDAAWHAGDIRQALASGGTPLGGYDLLIAGHARARGDVLVTRNVREFERVDGLVVEPW